MARVFSIIGDSNVRRHMNPTNCRDRPPMTKAQVLPCTKLEVFRQSLQSVRRESNVCLVACITNFLTDCSVNSSSVAQRVDPILVDFLLFSRHAKVLQIAIILSALPCTAGLPSGTATECRRCSIASPLRMP